MLPTLADDIRRVRELAASLGRSDWTDSLDDAALARVIGAAECWDMPAEPDNTIPGPNGCRRLRRDLARMAPLLETLADSDISTPQQDRGLERIMAAARWALVHFEAGSNRGRGEARVALALLAIGDTHLGHTLERETARADAATLEAQCWAMEAKAQRTTVREAYQAATGATGEPGDWHGAAPIREALERLTDEAAHLAGLA